ncbi:glycosyltransferase family 2 protein [Terasakiella pusilla]|uniref:glycosyltransferase family 2 protein n=1 Tax=Terasakiella pusilla TaxID=64973 RepID=UPI003AA9956A
MTDNLTLSVILPNYNHACWLEESLSAILSQERQPDELIFIDDGSTDNSLEVAQSLLKSLPYAKIIENEKNIGCVPTLNKGLELATGDYIYFGAADDKVLPMFFKKSMDLLSESPDVGLCSAMTEMIAKNGQHLGLAPAPQPSQYSRVFTAQQSRDLLYRHDSWFMGNTTIYRRRVLQELGGFSQELGALCDSFNCRVLAAKYGCAYIPQELVAWRQMEGGMAWSLASSSSEVKRVGLLARNLMETRYQNIFHKGYANRWYRRHIFEGWNFRRKLLLKTKVEAKNRSMTFLYQTLSLFLAFSFFMCMKPFDFRAAMQRFLNAHNNLVNMDNKYE